MPRVQYQSFEFKSETLDIIDRANQIIDQYAKLGYSLSLRQVFYQFVSRGYIPNTQQSYKRLGSIINDGRLAGMIDWDSIEDRTREHEARSHWSDPSEIIASAAKSWGMDLRIDQPVYVEVYVEKDALEGIIRKACQPLDVGFMSCRGYVSQSAIWRSAQRLVRAFDRGCVNQIVIIHLGDHDPSGIDMTRDIEDRLRLLGDDDVANVLYVDRIALNMDQIQKYGPPPNPAKLTDSRCAEYVRKHGDDSWELDALDPRVITKLIVDTVNMYTDQPLFDARKQEQEEHRSILWRASDRWDEVRSMLE